MSEETLFLGNFFKIFSSFFLFGVIVFHLCLVFVSYIRRFRRDEADDNSLDKAVEKNLYFLNELSKNTAEMLKVLEDIRKRLDDAETSGNDNDEKSGGEVSTVNEAAAAVNEASEAVNKATKAVEKVMRKTNNVSNSGINGATLRSSQEAVNEAVRQAVRKAVLNTLNAADTRTNQDSDDDSDDVTVELVDSNPLYTTEIMKPKVKKQPKV